MIERALAADGDVALFAHGHLLRIFGARWIEQPAAFGGRLGLSTAALSVLGFERVSVGSGRDGFGFAKAV